MAAMINVACSECGKEVQAPVNFVGKKVRCKACGHVFVAQPVPPQGTVAKSPTKNASSGKPNQPPAPKKGSSPPRASVLPDDDGDGKPYLVTSLDLTPRCPDCANEMESPEAIICLHCGYNTMTRMKAITRKVHDTTGQDYFIWLLPGIACALAVLSLIGFDIWYCLAIGALVEKEWYEFLSSGAIKMWVCIGSIYLMWLAGKFAFKRLVLNPHPPEIERN